jgi:bifunctional isochorismate lyase/aryl carrier protein
MALPVLSDYPLPTASEIPSGRAPWKLAVNRAALLIHDMQRYFLGAFPADAPMIAQVVANISSIRERCHLLGIPVFYTAQKGNQYLPDRGLQADFWGAGMSADPAHTAIVDALEPAPEDIVLEKFRYSAFQRSPFEWLLRARKRDQLIITGVYAHIGCLSTASEAFNRDVQPFLVVDAMAAYTRELHDVALVCATASFAAAATTESILRDLSEGAH